MRPPEYHNRPPMDFRPARGLVVRLALLIFLVIAALQSISFYIESLWYGSLGFGSVYWYRLRAQSIVFLIVAVITATALYIIFRLVTPPPGYSRRSFLQIGQEAIVIPTADTLKGLALPGAIIIGIFFGSLAALRTYDAKRMLAYSTFGQIGFILLGIGWGTPLALIGAIVYSVNHAFIKSSLLMITGVLSSRMPNKTAKLTDIVGAGHTFPLMGGLYILGGLALAGVPPMNGFISRPVA